MRVRESGIEVELAAYGLAKNSASLNYLLVTAESTDHAQKIWALWALGLMGNRGVEAGRVVQVLAAHLNDTDEDSRRWAVEGLALTGSDQAIQPLLKIMHDDPAPSVRERAACSLAESGMFTPEQRFHRRSAAIELQRRSGARCANSYLGLSGAERHYPAALAERLFRLAKLVRFHPRQLIRQNRSVWFATRGILCNRSCSVQQSSLRELPIDPMDKLNVVIGLTTRENDYQANRQPQSPRWPHGSASRFKSSTPTTTPLIRPSNSSSSFRIRRTGPLPFW